MKLLLVSRGSQGDIYPYLVLSKTLLSRGYTVTLSLPRLFEQEAKNAGVPYHLQGTDDIAGMLEDKPDTRNLLEWTKRVIDDQFAEQVPLLADHDMLVASNTEFAAPSIAEYHKKPLIRTAYGPFLPGPNIPPPVFPWPKPHPLFKPALFWKLLNGGLNMMVKKPLNRHRQTLNLPPIVDQGEHAPANAYNFLMYSPSLGSADPAWKWRWHIGGYCFNDSFPYDELLFQRFREFIKRDTRPSLFFTLGSCNATNRDRLAQWMYEICGKYGYKLIIGCGWWKVGSHLHSGENLFLLDRAIPHNLIFPHCDAIIHHGGSGTTHSAARAGKPQMLVPLLLDQPYWAYRVSELGLGPGGISIARVSKAQLEQRVVGLMTSAVYKQNATSIGEKVRQENGIEALCAYIERIGAAHP